jgi:hypothetical protein
MLIGSLPSIDCLYLEKANSDRADHARFSTTAGLNISKYPFPSSTAICSRPRPPYSYASTVATPAPAQSSYISPPEPSHPPAKDENEVVGLRKPLPSISEALGQDRLMAFASPIANTKSKALFYPSFFTSSKPFAIHFLEAELDIPVHSRSHH